MCGFLVVGSEEFQMQLFNDALDKAAYRGPDHQHMSVDHGVTWGFNRLSIHCYLNYFYIRCFTIITSNNFPIPFFTRRNIKCICEVST